MARWCGWGVVANVSRNLVVRQRTDVKQPARWYLTCLKERAEEPRIRRFREWLVDLVAEDPVIVGQKSPIAAQ